MNYIHKFILRFLTLCAAVLLVFESATRLAVEAYLAEVILGASNPGLARCLHVYRRSKNYDDLFTYEACIRKLLGNSSHFGHIKILPKGTAWARDNWMTNSLWSPERDFMMHNWKLTQLRTYKNTPLPLEATSNSEWYNPLAGRIDLPRCTPGRVTKEPSLFVYVVIDVEQAHIHISNSLRATHSFDQHALTSNSVDVPLANTSWSYDKNLIATRAVIDKRLDEFAAKVEHQREDSLARLPMYFSNMTDE